MSSNRTLVKEEILEKKLAAAVFEARPSIRLRVSVARDGDKWSALYGPNLQEGVCGFGDTPDEACLDFDENWFHQLAK